MSRKLVSYRLADDLQQALKERAGREGISATELVNRLLRQGLLEETPASSEDYRLSRLEQVLHQLEKRVDGVTETGTLAHLSRTLSSRLVAVEQRLEELATGVEEGCRTLAQLKRELRGPLLCDADAVPEADPRSVDSPGMMTYQGSLPPGGVLVSLQELRRLLQSGS